MGKLARVVIILVVIIAVLVGARNWIVKIAVEKGVKAATGLSLNIQEFDLNLAQSYVGIKGLKLLNPEGFPEKRMFHAPEIFVDYNLGDIIKGNIHIEDIRLNFDEFVIVKNTDGKTNLEALKPGKTDRSAKAGAKEKEAEKKDKKAPQVQIDHVALKVGKVIYKDYSRGGEPAVKEYNINISEEFNNIADIKSLLAAVAMKAVATTALGDVAGFNADLIKDAAAVPIKTLDTLKETAGTLKEKIKLPFGNE